MYKVKFDPFLRGLEPKTYKDEPDYVHGLSIIANSCDDGVLVDWLKQNYPQYVNYDLIDLIYGNNSLAIEIFITEKEKYWSKLLKVIHDDAIVSQYIILDVDSMTGIETNPDISDSKQDTVNKTIYCVNDSNWDRDNGVVNVYKMNINDTPAQPCNAIYEECLVLDVMYSEKQPYITYYHLKPRA